MQRFISGSSLPQGNPVVRGHLPNTLGRSGKEPEKPLGKIFGKMPPKRLFFANASLPLPIEPSRQYYAAEILCSPDKPA